MFKVFLIIFIEGNYNLVRIYLFYDHTDSNVQVFALKSYFKCHSMINIQLYIQYFFLSLFLLYLKRSSTFKVNVSHLYVWSFLQYDTRDVAQEWNWEPWGSEG